MPGAGNPQAWDRYAYSFNNPIKYNDPSGHFPIIPLLLIAAAALLIDACTTTAPIDTATTINSIDSSVNIASTSLSTAVGNNSLISHDHFYPSQTSTTYTAFNGTSLQISGDPNFVWSGSETSVISLPNSINSSSAQIADQSTIGSLATGDWLQVVYQNTVGDILSDSFQISSVSSNGFINMSDPNLIIDTGDSGGGAFYNGQLVGNTYNIQLDTNRNRIPYFTIAPIPSELYQWVK